MKVQLVGLRSTPAMEESGCPSLTPEMLAAVGARYSRNAEGLNAILSKVEGMDPDAAVDSIFSYVDYGHQSIADMVPVAMFMDKISMALVMELWRVCPTASGQESSTRYIQMAPDSTIVEALVGSEAAEMSIVYEDLFNAYGTALQAWNQVAAFQPELTGIPDELLASKDVKDVQKVERMRRNFAFDRARYFLPLGAYTNVMMVMPARAWVQLVQHLLSSLLPEAVQLGAEIRLQLQKVAPRLIRHAVADNDRMSLAHTEMRFLRDGASKQLSIREAEPVPFLELFDFGHSRMPYPALVQRVIDSLLVHKHRYSPFGEAIKRLTVRFGWSALPIAEIRDFNRHRTGHKYFPVLPIGCYTASDQIRRINNVAKGSLLRDVLKDAQAAAIRATQVARDRLAEGKPDYVYYLPLGAQCFYEHTTQAHFFAYQAELRTGVGTHYYYASCMRKVLSLFHEMFPGSEQLLKAGTSEPE